MIYIRLAGGLGNQLYQLAAAVLIGKYSNQTVVALTDGLSLYDQHRKPDALRLISSARIVTDSIKSTNCILKWLVIRARLGRWLPIIGINDRSALHYEQLAYVSNARVMDGYFQRGWTAEKFIDVITEFNVEPNSGEMLERISLDECVVHIRGGDFLLHPIHQVVDGNYYVAAIHLAKKNGWLKYAVLSDDPKYTDTLLEFIKKEISDLVIRVIPTSIEATEDFLTLRNARARIIGNSTFAWWASALDKNQAVTWSPSKFLVNLDRDFFLDWETSIKV